LQPSLKRNLPQSASCLLAQAILLLLIALAGTATSAAQTLKTGGTSEGTISDMSGGRIPAGKVSLRQVDTNQTRTVSADDQGFFRATDLQVGTYEVRVEAAGFAPFVHTGISFDVGTTVHLDVVLAAAGVAAEVTVSAQPPPIDPSQTSVTSAIDRERIEDLPVLSRNSLDFALLLPGVTSSSQGSGTGSRPVLPDSGLSFGGLRPRSNNISVDGLNVAKLVFSGTAREAAAGFPANVNVAAALSLAGIGPDRTMIDIWADPAVERNCHSIEVDSDSARFTLSIENVPSENPKTGRNVALSVIAALRKLNAPLAVGT